MQNPPEPRNRTLSSNVSSDFVILLLFLLIGGVMFLLYLRPPSDGIQAVKPTVVPTVSHSTGLDRLFVDALPSNIPGRMSEAFEAPDFSIPL
jgi:hypothetical protein